MNLRSCRWSLDAVEELEGLQRNDPNYKSRLENIQRHICDAETKTIYCCGPKQQPPSNEDTSTGRIQ